MRKGVKSESGNRNQNVLYGSSQCMCDCCIVIKISLLDSMIPSMAMQPEPLIMSHTSWQVSCVRFTDIVLTMLYTGFNFVFTLV